MLGEEFNFKPKLDDISWEKRIYLQNSYSLTTKLHLNTHSKYTFTHTTPRKTHTYTHTHSRACIPIATCNSLNWLHKSEWQHYNNNHNIILIQLEHIRTMVNMFFWLLVLLSAHASCHQALPLFCHRFWIVTECEMTCSMLHVIRCNACGVINST